MKWLEDWLYGLYCEASVTAGLTGRYWRMRLWYRLWKWVHGEH